VPIWVRSMLEVKNLAVRYGRHRALEGVSVSVRPGEICVVLGSNGAGKSTLLKAIAGTVRAEPGAEILAGGKSIARMAANRIVEEGVVLVPEGRGIFGDLTVAENLQLGAFARRARRDERATLDRVYTLFPKLAERRKQVARTMSGGEQQMVAIGRALMSKPDILMLDEPSLGLSPLLTQELFKSLAEIARTGVGILLVEQNARQSLKIARRGYLIENGLIKGEDSADALMHDPAVVNAYLGGAAAARTRITLPPPMRLPAGAGAIGRFVGDLAGRAGRIQSAFVRSLRQAGGQPSAFVGRYDPKTIGDPWKDTAAHVAPPPPPARPAAADARRLSSDAADLARRASERAAAHVRSTRLSTSRPSAFSVSSTKVEAPITLRRLQADEHQGPPVEAKKPADGRKSRLNGSRGLIGHNSGGFGIDEMAPPPAGASASPADLAARAASIHAAHVAARRKTLSAFVIPAEAAAAPSQPEAEAEPDHAPSKRKGKRKKTGKTRKEA
jgi:branched-chain amino acid transport system ATP-binding protein